MMVVNVLSRRVRVLAGMVVVLAVLAAPVAGAMGPALGGVDIPDSNIRMVVTGTKEECSAACDAEPACAAATFVMPGTIQGPDGRCYLKSASAPQVENYNCYSFVKQVIQPVFACVMSNPVADFSAATANTTQPPRGFAPLTVEFTDLSTGVAGGPGTLGTGARSRTTRTPYTPTRRGAPAGRTMTSP